MKRQKKAITKEQIAKIEAVTGIKIISFKKSIIKYEGKCWRPVNSIAEFICASFDNEPILKIHDTAWVSVKYQP